MCGCQGSPFLECCLLELFSESCLLEHTNRKICTAGQRHASSRLKACGTIRIADKGKQIARQGLMRPNILSRNPIEDTHCKFSAMLNQSVCLRSSL
eukprot:c39782_g1_i1 orf=1-285(-)